METQAVLVGLERQGEIDQLERFLLIVTPVHHLAAAGSCPKYAASTPVQTLTTA